MTSDIPLVRKKIDYVLGLSGFTPGGHNYKQLAQILQVFPRDELLQIDGDTLSRQALSVLRLQERSLTRIMSRVDPLGFFATVLLYIPRDRYDTDVRTQVQNMLAEAFDAQDIEFNTTFSESVHARVQFIVRLNGPVQVLDSTLQQGIELIVQSWDDLLVSAMTETYGEAKGQQLARQYCHNFPAGYREDFDAQRAVLDIAHLIRLDERSPMDLSLFFDLSSQRLHLKLFHLNSPVSLSDALPIMEHLGVKVLADQTYGSRDRQWYIHDFTLDAGDTGDLADWRDDWQQAFAAAWYQRTESDSFHQLVIKAALDWREISVLRASAATSNKSVLSCLGIGWPKR